MRLLGTSNVDLVVMNDAPLYLNFEIIREGKIFYCRDEGRRIDFELYIASRYRDRKYYQDRRNRMVLERIREGK